MPISIFSSAGRAKPRFSSHAGLAEPRPPASTTRSAKTICSAPLPILTRTPLISEPFSFATRPCTAQASIARTLGSASSRRRMWPSSTGREANRPTRSLGAVFSSSPRPIQYTSLETSPLAPPLATTSSVQPGKKSSIKLRPRASSPCAWRPCGTPLRGTSVCGKVSRSSTVTAPKKSASARAASKPPMPPPITTACSPTCFMMTLRAKDQCWSPAGRGLGSNRIVQTGKAMVTKSSAEASKPDRFRSLRPPAPH